LVHILRKSFKKYLLVELSDGGSGGFVDTGIADLSGVRVGYLLQSRFVADFT